MATVNDTPAAQVRGADTARSHSAAARRHLRRGYGMEERLRTLLDDIPYGSVGGLSCAHLSAAFKHLEQAIELLTAVERREVERYEAVASVAA